MGMGSARKKRTLAFLLVAWFGVGASCAGTSTKSESTEAKDSASKPSSEESIETKVDKLSKRLEALNSQLTEVTKKVETSHVAIENYLQAHQPETAKAPGSLAKAPKIISLPDTARSETGFQNDSPVRKYRDAMIYYEGRKFSDAILAFSDFLKNHADHPLAGSAQFHIGKSYYNQEEFKLAAQEFNRVLVSYDRSSHVPSTLKFLSESLKKLNMNKEADQNIQLLRSLFPQSPAAKNLLMETSAGRKQNYKEKYVATAPVPDSE
jgi:TolA-binding protein